MADEKPDLTDPVHHRHKALSRWDSDGGAQPAVLPSGEALREVPELTNTELVHLRIRVIALENLVISLLAAVSGRQIGLAREMAAYICPRPGFTPHPLTIRAAHQMIDLVERSGHFRGMPS